ncbi:hypothetical protein D9M70_439180 [compost metagenome]
MHWGAARHDAVDEHVTALVRGEKGPHLLPNFIHGFGHGAEFAILRLDFGEGCIQVGDSYRPAIRAEHVEALHEVMHEVIPKCDLARERVFQAGVVITRQLNTPRHSEIGSRGITGEILWGVVFFNGANVGSDEVANELTQCFVGKGLLAPLQVGRQLLGRALNAAVAQHSLSQQLYLLESEDAPPHFLADHALKMRELLVCLLVQC